MQWWRYGHAYDHIMTTSSREPNRGATQNEPKFTKNTIFGKRKNNTGQIKKEIDNVLQVKKNKYFKIKVAIK